MRWLILVIFVALVPFHTLVAAPKFSIKNVKRNSVVRQHLLLMVLVQAWQQQQQPQNNNAQQNIQNPQPLQQVQRRTC